MKTKALLSLSSLLLIGSIFFLCTNKVSAENNCYYINNNDICMTEENYNNLLSLDFDEDEIANMILSTFNDNKDLSGQVVAETTNYYLVSYYHTLGNINTSSTHITEEQYNNFIPLTSLNNNRSDGYVETTAKKMRTTITQVGSKYRYKNRVDWKTMPSVRSNDIIGIGLEYGKVHISSNGVFNLTYCVDNINCTSTYSSAITQNFASGTSSTFPLPTGSYVKMYAVLYYDVSKDNPSQTVTSLNAYGDYSHAVESVSQFDAAYSHTVNAAGNVLYSSIITKYDAIPSADAYWSGSW